MPPLTREQLAVRTAILEADQAADWEEVACPCGASGRDIVLSEIDRYGLPARNVVCGRCGLIRLSPRWREARYRRFYEEEYRRLYNPSPLSKPDYARWVADALPTRDRTLWVETAWRRLRGGLSPRIVEIGTGGGWNLARLPQDWTRIGYDVDDEYLRVGRDLFGIDLRHGLVSQALPEAGAADIVLLSHVIEHLADPSGVLGTIGALLRADAMIMIEVPGVFRLHRTNLDPRSYMQNAHTFTYCAATLRQACARAGLEVIELDETARAVCRRGSARVSIAPRSDLARRIVTYLRRCEFGYRQYRRLRGVPVVGRLLAYAWRRTWFAALGMVSGRSE